MDNLGKFQKFYQQLPLNYCWEPCQSMEIVPLSHKLYSDLVSLNFILAHKTFYSPFAKYKMIRNQR